MNFFLIGIGLVMDSKCLDVTCFPPLIKIERSKYIYSTIKEGLEASTLL
jgi:hypothetical protein